MKLTRQTVNTFGLITIAIMFVMLMLVWLRLIPEWLTIPFFIVALLLFVARIIMRIKLAKLERATSNRQ